MFPLVVLFPLVMAPQERPNFVFIFISSFDIWSDGYYSKFAIGKPGLSRSPPAEILLDYEELLFHKVYIFSRYVLILWIRWLHAWNHIYQYFSFCLFSVLSFIQYGLKFSVKHFLKVKFIHGGCTKEQWFDYFQQLFLCILRPYHFFPIHYLN